MNITHSQCSFAWEYRFFLKITSASRLFHYVFNIFDFNLLKLENASNFHIKPSSKPTDK